MRNPFREFQIVTANLALFLGGVYVLSVVVGGLAALSKNPDRLWLYPALLLPAFFFVPSARAAFDVHFTDNHQRATQQCRRAIALALIGWAVTVIVLVVGAQLGS